MANLPTNEAYGAAAASYVPKKIKYTPNTLYKNLGQLKQRYETGVIPPSSATQDKQAAVFKYGNSLFNYGTEDAPDFKQGIPTGRSFMPTQGDLRTPIPIDRTTYGEFQAPASYNQNGENISWGTPVSPVIRNISGSGITGQYVEDTTNPELLAKTIRPNEGKASFSDKAILAGRPGWMYQIDHIMPLNLGGADTLANRQLLSQGENDKKTRAQAVAYTLYGHINPETGKNYISLSEARNMAMQWKNQDVEGLPQPNTVGFVSDQAPQGLLGMMPGAKGKTGLQLALEAQKRWSQPKVPTVKDVLAGIPQAAKDLGKGWLPDPLREFIKGAESEASLGFIPYEQGEGQGTTSKVTGILGRIVGSFAPWSLINKVVKIPYYFLGARKVFASALAGKLFGSTEALTTAAKTSVGMDLKALPLARDAIYAEHLARGGTALGKPALAETAMTSEVAKGIAQKGINKPPGYFARLYRDPKTIETATQFAVTNAIFSQAVQYVGNHLSPQVLSGQAFEQDEKNLLGTMIKDMSLGALFGAQSRTLKGTAYATMLPVTIGLWSNPDDPIDAIVSGAVFGALHAHSVLSVPQKGFLTLPKFKVPKGYNDVGMLGGKAYNDPVLQSTAHVVDHLAHSVASSYTDLLPRNIDISKPVPKYSKEQLDAGRSNSVENAIRLLVGSEKTGSKITKKRIGELKALPEKINKQLNTVSPEVKTTKISRLGNLTKYFTPSGREELKAASKNKKEGEATIRNMFGAGWQSRLGEVGKVPVAEAPVEKPSLIPTEAKPLAEKPVAEAAPEPQEGILSFEAARAEIARITVAYRHLYKMTLPHEGDPNIRGVVKEFRGKADLDDLLSVTERHQRERSKSLLDILQRPEAAGHATDVLLKAENPAIAKIFPKGFMEERLPSTPDYANKSFITGLGLDAYTPQGKAFIEELLKTQNGRYMGDASPTLIGVLRPEVAPLTEMKNASLSKEDIASGKSAIDPNPKMVIQVFGVRKNANGEAYMVELGFIPSDHRLNTGRYAMNKNAAQFDLPKVGMNKDQMYEMADKENLSVILLNADPIMKTEGPMSGKPYLFVNVSPQTMEASRALRDSLIADGYKNPIAVDATKASQAISEIKTKGMEPATQNKEAMMNNPGRKAVEEYIPTYLPNTPAAPVAEVTKQVLQNSREAINVSSPAELQVNFQRLFGITLKEPEAQELWDKREFITMEEMGTRLLRAANNGKTSEKTAIDVEFMRDYINSGALKYSLMGEAVIQMPVIGHGEAVSAKENVTRSIEETQKKYSGVEDQAYPGPLLEAPPAVGAPPVEVPTVNATRVAEPATVTQEPVTQSAVTQPTASLPQTTNPVRMNPERIMGGFQESKTLPTEPIMKKPTQVTQTPVVSNESPTAIAENYFAEGRDAIDNVQPPGRRYSAGDESMVYAATKKYADIHQSVISGMEDRLQSDLQSRNIPKTVIDEAKQQLRSELENHSASILGMTTGKSEAIQTPRAFANEFYKGIDEGIASKEPAAQYWNKSLDKGLKDMLGLNYRDDPKVIQILDDYFGGKGAFSNFTNKEGREIQQTPDIAKALASGDRKAYFAALDARRQQNISNKAGTGGDMTEQELRALGVEPGEGDFAGMSVRPSHQEGLIGDLSRGENLMMPIFGGEGPTTGKQSVLAVRTLFLGQGKTGENGLKAFILARYPKAKRSVSLDQLERDAVAADAIKANRERILSNRFTKAKELLSSLKKEEETINKSIAPPDERPKWQTPEVVKSIEETIKEIQARIVKGEKFLEEAKPDAAGGPGYHDGAGGPGGISGAIGGAMKNLWNGGNVVGGLMGKSVYNAPSPSTYNIRGVNVNDSDLNAAAPILFNEISNLPPEHQQFEINNIINTAVNRSLNPGLDFGKTLTQVLQRPAQYQGYAPHGTTGPGGKTIQSQYQRVISGDLDEPSRKKLQNIKDALNKIKAGNYLDTTAGAQFYVHASDGTLWLGQTTKEAKQSANNHEKQKGIKVTQWGTAVGMPVSSPLALKTLGKK